MLISFEVRVSFEVRDREGPDSEVLDLFLDQEGLASLLGQLEFLRGKKTDHVHLMAESWGGFHLNDEPVNDTAKPMRHVQITVI